MKTFYFVLLLSIYLLTLIYYFPNRDYIKGKIRIALPPFFSPSNTAAISVTKQQRKRSNSINIDTSPLPNTAFSYSPDPFTIDSTENLRSLGLSCIPDSFGYTVDRGNEVFPPYEYPKCSVMNKQNDTYLHIDRNHNILYMDCPDNSNNNILVGPFDKRKLINREEGYPEWEVNSYKGPIDASTLEFGLGSCDSDGDKLMQVDTVPIFQEEAYVNAKKLTKSKPRLIYFLTLDSMSRRHYFRKMSGTIEYLNSLNSDPKSEFSVFDFNLHNILGGDSADNQVPMLGGDIHFPKTKEGSQNHDFLGEKALWNILREKGYVSLLALESCDHNFINALGRNPDVDYVLGPFNCAVAKFTSAQFGTGNSMQRCVGGHQTHYYVLNYTLAVMEMNPDVNMFMYIHLDAAHEATGQHAATLNDDITEYLQELLGKYKDTHEIAIFLQADHGMRYGNFYKELSAYQEQKLPGFFFVASKALLEKYEYSYNSLSLNTQRLVSKMDCRETALYLANVTETSLVSVNLLTTIAPKSRTCDDLDINPWECSCLKTIEIANPNTRIKDLAEFLRDYAENVINSISYTDPKHPIGRICKKITLGKILKIYQIGVNNVEEIFKLEIESPTREGMKFQVTYFLAADGLQMSADKDKFKVETYAYKSYPLKVRVIIMQILTISRIDTFAGDCENTARLENIRAEFCACQ